jgi:hypothetical protein
MAQRESKDWIRETIALHLKLIFFQNQELMFEPCRLFAQRYHALILGAAQVETQLPLSWKLNSDAAKRLNGCFNKEFNGPVLQVTKKQWKMRDFLERVNQIILERQRQQHLDQYVCHAVGSIVMKMKN